jgi:hypothetical protein
MKKISYITIGIALLAALFFAGKEIYWQIRLSNAVEAMSQRYVYVSGAHLDHPNAMTEEVRLRQAKIITSFQLFYHIASDRRIEKEMYSSSPSMRVYAYFAKLIKTNDVDFDYLSEQMEFRDEVKYTDGEYFEKGCFACDVMLRNAISSKYAPFHNLAGYVNVRDFNYTLTKPQADSILYRMTVPDDYSVYLWKDVIRALERRAGE